MIEKVVAAVLIIAFAVVVGLRYFDTTNGDFTSLVDGKFTQVETYVNNQSFTE